MGLYRAARHGPAPVFGSGRSSRNSRIFLHLLLPPPSRGAEGILVRRAGGPDLSSIFQGRPGAPPPRSEGLYRAPQRGPRSEPEPGESCWNRIPAPPLPFRPTPLAGRRVDPRKKGPPDRAWDAGRTPLGWPSGQDPLVCGPGELFGGFKNFMPGSLEWRPPPHNKTYSAAKRTENWKNTLPDLAANVLPMCRSQAVATGGPRGCGPQIPKRGAYAVDRGGGRPGDPPPPRPHTQEPPMSALAKSHT